MQLTHAMAEGDFSELRYTLTGTAPANCSDGTGIQPATNISITAGGTRVLKAVACDDLGNMSSAVTRTYTYDNTAPAVPGVDTADTSFNTTFDVQLTHAMAEGDFSELRYTLTGTAPADCSDGTGIQPATNISITAGGTRVLKAVACDDLGNMSSAVTRTYTYDNVPPGSPSISISSGADYATSTSVTVGLSATDAAGMYVTNTADCAGGGTWESYNTTKVWTLGQTDAVATVYVKFRDDLENETACENDTIIHDGTDPTEPGSVDDAVTHDSETESPTISWVASSDANGIDHYELAIGTSAGGTQTLDWTDVGNVTSMQITSGVSLTDGATYYASVRAVDSAGRTSTAGQGDGWTVSLPASCPANWVLVPANAAVGASSDFCVMKYEAKIQGDDNGNQAYNASFVAESREGGTPWVDITRDQAITECDALGAEYDLISNAHWQAIARNIENRASNWSVGPAVGDGDLNRGHSDNDPSQACDATVDNVKTDCSTADGAAPHSQKRTHTLSNDEVIWDIAGNVWEWVSDDNSTDQGANTKVSLKEWDGIQDVDEDAAARLKWGPEGDYWSTHSSGEYGGFGHGWLSYSAGTVLRGGGWVNTGSGVFAARLNYGPSHSNVNIGFRCVRSP